MTLILMVSIGSYQRDVKKLQPTLSKSFEARMRPKNRYNGKLRRCLTIRATKIKAAGERSLIGRTG